MQQALARYDEFAYWYQQWMATRRVDCHKYTVSLFCDGGGIAAAISYFHDAGG
jgi:hypothetical protein